MSAVSKMLTPASRQRPTRRLASSTPVDPHALKNSFPPQKVPVPKHSVEILSPESPSSLYSIEYLLSLFAYPQVRFFGRISRAGKFYSKAQTFWERQRSVWPYRRRH